tara:strand:+ start:794 stop:1927 length:1134 start_codon:yes stop_codon:yes gene_type:complete
MSISPLKFYQILKKNEVRFFTGVPDSLLKQFCLCLDNNVQDKEHIIAANEGNAISLATGHHLATGKIPLVYMQNSGLGNAVNPLLSLSDTSVYSIPILLLIGWRGEPGINDEPQHLKQGKIQLDIMRTLGIPYEVISGNEIDIDKKIAHCVKKALGKSCPIALIVKKGTFNVYKSPATNSSQDKLMTREESLEIVLKNLPKDSLIISTTGKTSREIFEIREKHESKHSSDFLTVGSMGHCSSIALGIAISARSRNIICIDGDGSLIMHMGSLCTIGNIGPKNFFHILINNFVHDSVGGQPTAAKIIDMKKLVKSNNYKYFLSVTKKNELVKNLDSFIKSIGPSFLEIIVKPGARNNLIRPTISPAENKRIFMDNINK